MTAFAHPLPAFGCDCHVHVFGPFDRFALDPRRAYTPGPASVEDLCGLLTRLALRRVVVVQASPQGDDNACLVDALQRINAAGVMQARGVAVISEQTSDVQLRQMHEAGVRGVRVNLESAGEHNPEVGAAQMRWAAQRVAPYGWHVQTYTTLPVIASMADVLMQLPVPVVIDHFGRATAAKGVAQAGFDKLLALLASGRAWIKLSAVHRISDEADAQDGRAIARALIEANPQHTLWGTDWPHPGAWHGKPRSPDVIEPFHPIDDIRALQRISEWVSAAEWQAMLESNPAMLYDF